MLEGEEEAYPGRKEVPDRVVPGRPGNHRQRVDDAGDTIHTGLPGSWPKKNYLSKIKANSNK